MAIDPIDVYRERDEAERDYAGSVNANLNAAAFETHYDKFRASQGHGFAAEQANNLYDRLMGKDAVIVGGDNARNGPDRRVNGQLIQSKYCKTAEASVNAAFKNNEYRYLNSDGTLMQLEVPSEQYNEAVREMQKHIRKGQVPGITDPSDAKDIIRKGNVSYQQAKNIAKFGTIDSLTFDAANGVVSSGSAFGISALITYAKSFWNGDEPNVALETALYSGIQMGGAAFVNTVLTAQLMRTGVSQALVAPSNTIVTALGPKTSAKIANALRDGANIYGSAAMNNVAKLFRTNLLTSSVMLLVVSAGDIRKAFNGRISGKQLFKNMTTAIGGIGGGTAGLAVGGLLLNLVVPGAGTVAGVAVSIASSAVGGSIGAKTTHAVLDKFIEDDAVAMVKIIEDVFCREAEAYLLSGDEVEIIIKDIELHLDNEKLLDMFASDDREKFAEDFICECIERQICLRTHVYMTFTEEGLANGIKLLVTDAENGTGIFSADCAQPDCVEIGRQITGKEYSEYAAKRAMYAAKQMHATQIQSEMLMKKMAENEQNYQQSLQDIQHDRDKMKSELNALLGGQKVMSNELCVVIPENLTAAECEELGNNIEALISAHKNNGQEINRLVFESVAAMTAGEEYEHQLAKKKGLKRFLGGITGSNKALQDKINSNRAAAQWASQQTLQRLAEQNLMSFELISVVNNQLNTKIDTSVVAIEREINDVYSSLLECFKQSKADVARLETRVDHLDLNAYLTTLRRKVFRYNGIECAYAKLDDTSKMICVVRDFYDLTKGAWTENDCQEILQSAMDSLEIKPEEMVYYPNFISQLSERAELQDYLFHGRKMTFLPDPEYLPLLSGLKKRELLETEERYIVESAKEYLAQHNIESSNDDICASLTENYLLCESNMPIRAEVERYSLALELLFSLKQAEAEHLFNSGESIDSEEDMTSAVYTTDKFTDSVSSNDNIIEENNTEDVAESESSQALEKITIQRRIVIEPNEEKVFSKKEIHFADVLECKGKLIFDHCVLIYGEDDTGLIKLSGSLSNVTIKNCIVRDSSYIEESYFINGKGASNSCLTIQQSKIEGCKFFSNAKKLFITQSEFHNCLAPLFDTMDGTINTSIFDSCFQDSGYEFVMEGELHIQDCSFDRCSEICRIRGGTLSKCQFYHCFGSLIRANMSDVEVRGCQFVNCDTAYPGSTGKADTLCVFRGRSHKVLDCSFYGIQARENFIIEGETELPLNGKYVLEVQNCIFSNCQTNRASRKLIRTIGYYNGAIIKNYEQRTVDVKDCSVLEKVGPDTYRKSSKILWTQTNDGNNIGVTEDLPE